MAILEADCLTVRFGGIVAVDGAMMSAESGEVTGLIGPNGAGKTTMFNMLCGLQRPNSGAVRFDGRDITRRTTTQRARLGLARTFQRLELFDVLTCAENVHVAAEAVRSPRRSDALTEVEALLERVGLADAADVRADELPTGRARGLEIARALATRPRVLLLDEPAAGLSQRETDDLATLVRSLAADEGLAVVLVEHDMSMVMAVCDRVTVLDAGRVIADGEPADVRRDPAVMAAYFGTMVDDR